MTLQSNPDDANALATLKEKNPALYELYSYAKAAKSKNLTALKAFQTSSNEIIYDASKYHVAVLEKRSLESELYRDMALVEGAYLDIKASKTKEAKEKLSLIDERSPVATIAQFLRHSLVKAK